MASLCKGSANLLLALVCMLHVAATVGAGLSASISSASGVHRRS